MPIPIRAFTALLIAWGLSHAGTLVLKRAWIEQFKDRATIDASFTVDHAHKTPNPGANDGDIHVAGRAPKEIGLPMVAEVMNASNDQPAVKLIHSDEGNGKFIAVTGAWRLWFEHPPSSGVQTQFDDVPPAANTNPDHCFEIHPLTNVGGNDLTASFHDIKGFTPKDAQAAFASYEKLSVTVRANATAVTLDSPKSGYNYVLFVIRALGGPTKLQDGGFAVMCDVAADTGDQDAAIAQNVRMIFVPGTEPWKEVQKGFSAGDELKVLGIPRVNLNAVSAFINAAGKTVAGAAGVKRKLPYEMIIVAVEP
jgi:hypothetical protein